MEDVAIKKNERIFSRFAAGIYDRMRKAPRNLTAIAEASEIDYNTLQLYGAVRKVKNKATGKIEETRSTPSVWSIYVAARAADVSPAWLAFGMGPQDPVAAQLAMALGNDFEKSPGLDAVTKAYVRGEDADRQALLTFALHINERQKKSALTATAKTESKTVKPIRGAGTSEAFQPAPHARQSTVPLAATALVMAKELNRLTRSTLAEHGPAWDAIDRASRLLVELSETLNQPHHPNPYRESPDVDEPNATAAANAESHPDNTVDPVQKVP